MSQTDQKIETRLQSKEQQFATILYDNARGAVLGSLFNILLVTFALSLIDLSLSLIIWTGIAIVLNLIRWLNYKNFVNHRSKRSDRSWINNHRFLTFLSGALYGALAVFFFNPELPEYQAMIVFLVGGMGAASVGTYAVDLVTFRLFLLSSILPLMFRVLYEQTTVYVTLSVMLVSLIMVMLRSGKQANAVLQENFEMSYSLQYRATHDSLVGLLNREEFKNVFLKEQSSSRSEADTVALIFIDLDNFKALNDTYGHQAGDDALIRIGEIIRSAIRKEDIAARFGGDEFMVLIHSQGVEAARLVAEKIIKKIDEFKEELNQMDRKLGASVGIGYTQNKGIEFETLLKAADQACYQAKTDGKSRVSVKEAQ